MTSYINQLKDLTPKSADIESTFIIRDLKKNTPAPLTYEKIFDYFSLFFVSESEKAAMNRAASLIEPAIDAIIAIGHSKDPAFEPINLKRAVEMLREIPEPLNINIDYATTINLWQEDFTQDFAPLMNSIPSLSTTEEKIKVNKDLNAIFNRLLRNDHMAFNFKDIISEVHKKRVSDLLEAIEAGFLFKISLEDELKKVSFEERKLKIADAKLRANDDIKKMVREIKKGVDAAYGVNLRMVNWAIVVYSYIKIMNTGRR
jgi:hypothetical protein